MKFVVKNTTRSGLLDLLCPHTCRGCGRLGAVLCECCKNDLPESPLRVCPLFQQVLADTKKMVRRGGITGVKIVGYPWMRCSCVVGEKECWRSW